LFGGRKKTEIDGEMGWKEERHKHRKIRVVGGIARCDERKKGGNRSGRWAKSSCSKADRGKKQREGVGRQRLRLGSLERRGKTEANARLMGEKRNRFRVVDDEESKERRLGGIFAAKGKGAGRTGEGTLLTERTGGGTRTGKLNIEIVSVDGQRSQTTRKEKVEAVF